MRKYLLTLILIIFIIVVASEALGSLLLYLGLIHHNHTGFKHFGNWALVIFYSLLFGFFVLAFAFPQKNKNWRQAGLFQGFVIALYFEMYGFPLTIYILSSYLGYNLNFSHANGHLLAKLLSPLMDTALAEVVVMLISNMLIIVAALLIYFGWLKIYFSRDELVTDGIYKFLRHPQYLGFILITVALLIHWPTLITVLMWPILLIVYLRLAKKEDNYLASKYGKHFREYKAKTGGFIPKFR